MAWEVRAGIWTQNYFPNPVRMSDLEAKLSPIESANYDEGNATTVFTVKMAAFVKAVNAKIRAHPVLNYVCSTREFTVSIRNPPRAHRPVIGQPPRLYRTVAFRHRIQP